MNDPDHGTLSQNQNERESDSVACWRVCECVAFLSGGEAQRIVHCNRINFIIILYLHIWQQQHQPTQKSAM